MTTKLCWFIILGRELLYYISNADVFGMLKRVCICLWRIEFVYAFGPVLGN